MSTLDSKKIKPGTKLYASIEKKFYIVDEIIEKNEFNKKMYNLSPSEENPEDRGFTLDLDGMIELKYEII